MECLGGNGYVEEGGQGIMARIYREMPLNSIWEGAGNIMALDLRAPCARAIPPQPWPVNLLPPVAPTRTRQAGSVLAHAGGTSWLPRWKPAASHKTWHSPVQAALGDSNGAHCGVRGVL